MVAFLPGEIAPTGASRSRSAFRVVQRTETTIAGWRSWQRVWAHNPEVAGSSPAPATIHQEAP